MGLKISVCLVLVFIATLSLLVRCKGEEVFIEFKDSAYSVVEGDRFYIVTLVKQGEPREDLVVSIFPSPDSTAADTVEFPSDYTQGGQITFSPGGPDEMTTQLQVQDDRTLERNETLLLILSLNRVTIERGGRIGARNESRLTVINDDMVWVMFQQQLMETNESTQVQFSVTFTPQDTEIPFTFIVETFDVPQFDARAGVDYQPLRRNVTLSEFQRTEYLAVDIVQDNIAERTEAFGVRIIIPAETQQLGVLLGTPSEMTIRIIDDDPPIAIKFKSRSVTVNESDGSVTVNLLRTGNHSDNFTVCINVTMIIDPAIAQPAINVTKVIVNIPPNGEDSIPLVLNLQDDGLVEPVDFYILTIVNVSDPNVIVGDINTTIITVNDDDELFVTIEFKDSAYSVVEGDHFYIVTLVKQGEPREDLVVSIFPSPDPTAADTVEFPSDYTQGGQITFSPGGPDEMTTQLQVQDDRTLERNETLLLTLSLNRVTIERGGRIGARNESRLTVINDDMVWVMFQQQLMETNESTQVQFSVTFTPQDTEIPFTFIVETFNLSPPDARAGIDYQPLRRNVTLSEFRTTEHLTVDIIQDNITERTKAFGVRIVIPAETQQLGVSLGTQSELIIRIIDDDPGELEIIVFTNTTGDKLSGHIVQLYFDANQDDVTYRCRINHQPLIPCTSPHIFMNIDISETVTVVVEGIIAMVFPVKTAIVTKNVFIAMGGLQVVGVGAMAVQLEATENATYKCRLNNVGEYINCFDGQVFRFLTAGTYILFIEATATENTNEVAYNTFGPVHLAVGANANTSEAIAACFGRQQVHCNNVTNQECQYIATWRTRGHRVEFMLVAQTQGWVGIGFSTDRRMPRSDIIVGAASNAAFFVDDRYAENRIEPPQDSVQNIDSTSASFVDGVTTVQFSRDKITNDSDKDLSLSMCHFLLFAWSGNANISSGVIQFHGSQNQAISDTLVCFPSPSLCPERFDCGDPEAPENGTRSFTDTLEGSIVTYTCDTGFEVVGNHTQTCQLTPDGAFWSFTRPQCIFMPATSSDHDAVSAAVISGAVIGTTLPLLVVVVIVIMAVVLSRRRKRSRSMPDEAKLMDVPSSQQHTHSTSGQSHETKLYISTSPNSKQIGKKSEYHVLTDNESTQHELVESTSFGGTMDDEVTTDPTDNGNTDPNPSCSLSQDDQ